jgi:threonine dehydrogenase-like Zn-dependent dehydrogenase
MTTLQPAITVVPGRPETFGIRDHPMMPLGPGMVRVRPRVIATCKTDVAVRLGRYHRPVPGWDYIVQGHECVAEVTTEVADDVMGVTPGSVCALRVRFPDPAAPDVWARLGRVDLSDLAHYLEAGMIGMHGYWQPDLVLPAAGLVALPPGLPLELGVLADLLACVTKGVREAFAIRAVKLGAERAADLPPARAFVLGTGPAGLLATLCLRRRGLEVCVVDVLPDDARKARVARRLGARYLRGPRAIDERAITGMVEATVRDLGGFDVGFEATGIRFLGELWTRALGTVGQMIWFGIPEADRTIEDTTIEARARHAITANLGATNTINAAPTDWDDAVALLARLHDELPWLGPELLHPRIAWEDVAALRDAPEMPDAIKPHVVMPR